MRTFSLLFAFISLVLLVQLGAYLLIGSVAPVFVVVLLIGFAACAGAALSTFSNPTRAVTLYRRSGVRRATGRGNRREL